MMVMEGLVRVGGSRNKWRRKNLQTLFMTRFHKSLTFKGSWILYRFSYHLRAGRSEVRIANHPYPVWGPRRLLFNGHWFYFPEIRRPGREIDHWPPSIAQVKIDYSCEISDVSKGYFTLSNFENSRPVRRLQCKQVLRKGWHRDTGKRYKPLSQTPI